jgi:GNAT superfamily N-acetyltransferase
MPVTIRQAVSADTPLILDLIRALAEYERLADACVATEEQLTASLFGPSPDAEVIIAEWDGKPAGFALYFHTYSTFLARRGLWLEDLFVRPELRGNGVGKALLRRLAQIAIERDCGRLEWAVLDWNAPAIGFYRSLGAVPLDDWITNRMTGAALEALAGPAG